MKYIIGGLCGIGKSTVSRLISDRYEIVHLDLDEIRAKDMERRRGRISPCSIGQLNLEKCLKDILDSCGKGFVLDIGGDSIFREGKDNQERLAQVLWLKSTYHAKVIVLFAENKEARQRFITTKNREVGEFPEIWKAWKEIEKPYWLRCSDRFIDTTGHVPEALIPMVLEI